MTPEQKIAHYEEFVAEVRIEHPESDDGENFCSKCRAWSCYALLALKQLEASLEGRDS